MSDGTIDASDVVRLESDADSPTTTNDSDAGLKRATEKIVVLMSRVGVIVSATTLGNAVGIVIMARKLGTESKFAALTASARVALLPLRHPKMIEKLASELTETEGTTVRQIRSIVRAWKRAELEREAEPASEVDGTVRRRLIAAVRAVSDVGRRLQLGPAHAAAPNTRTGKLHPAAATARWAIKLRDRLNAAIGELEATAAAGAGGAAGDNAPVRPDVGSPEPEWPRFTSRGERVSLPNRRGFGGR